MLIRNVLFHEGSRLEELLALLAPKFTFVLLLDEDF